METAATAQANNMVAEKMYMAMVAEGSEEDWRKGQIVPSQGVSLVWTDEDSQAGLKI
jgi:hypothetical protein